MKTSFIVPIAATMMVLGSCSHTSDANVNNGSDYIERASSVISQTITAKGSSAVTFNVSGSWGSSCGTFSRAEIGRSGSEYTIKIFGKQPKSAVCLAVMSSFNAPLTIDLPSPGTYRFKFWQSDTANIDTTFTIK
jgi:hypothetical protein